mmetsp:Transcript_18960/g.39966  ORF Transcript_18960/g.39966 Transcript_18960/m.39966 type:complete len:459 (-) Transcript_18960:178-1554(-)
MCWHYVSCILMCVAKFYLFSTSSPNHNHPTKTSLCTHTSLVFILKPSLIFLSILSLVPFALIHQPSHRLLRRTLHHPMSQIQQMLIARPTSLVNAIPHGLLDLLLRTKQYRGINVARDGDLRSQYLSRLLHVDGPIHGDHVASHVSLELKVGGSSVGKVNDGDVGVFVLHYLNGLLGGGFGESFELGRAHLVRPGFEDLDDLCATLYLMTSIIPNHHRELVQKFRHGLGTSILIGHHHLLGGQTMLAALALDRVRAQREGSAHESDERRVRLLGLLGQRAEYLPDERQRRIEVHALRIVQLRHVLLAPHLRGNDRTDPPHDIKLDPQRRQRGQNVGKHDDPVHAVRAMALQAQLDGHAGRFGPFAEGIDVGVLTEGGHVPAGLAHEPDGGAFGGFAAGRADEDVAVSRGGAVGDVGGGGIFGHGGAEDDGGMLDRGFGGGWRECHGRGEDGGGDEFAE